MASISIPRGDAEPKRGATIHEWNPEDKHFWETTGSRVAWRNLYCSMPALLLAFAVWMVWSTVVVKLKSVGFNFNDEQLFWLAALPGLSGATLRIFYSFLVPILGGRNFTVASTASLLIPAVGMGLAVQNPAMPYWVFVVLALLTGFGGGNFASSMSNISFFFPKAQKGTALGLNAGLGNLGVSVVQLTAGFVIPVAMFGALAGGPQRTDKGALIYLQNIAFIWIPLIVASCVASWFLMNNLATAKASFRDQSVIFSRKHNWIMCWLYVGTFGSFIGYSAGLTMLIKTQFPAVDPLKYAFMGPLVGALIRPVGGWLSDKVGGARVTFWNFIVMTVAVIGVVYFLRNKEAAGAFRGFLAMFVLLFATTGIGNGSTFRMVPIIFLNCHEKWRRDDTPDARAESVRNSSKEAAAVLGFSSAIGAYGAAIIPLTFGWSIKYTGAPFVALYGFVAFYVTCIAITWWFYSRRGAEAPC
ncbi:MAG: NarK family nitrate/nitrite MFS transporter [Candidatus Sumerlaeaceae bacterium]|nr:NarK family nitrate/nitrite MFS transporter [Candidatus Sumerlaeaceae bacterium]